MLKFALISLIAFENYLLTICTRVLVVSKRLKSLKTPVLQAL